MLSPSALWVLIFQRKYLSAYAKIASPPQPCRLLKIGFIQKAR